MANVFDYLDWRGDLTLDLVPLCDVDAVVLSRLSYLPLDGLVPPEGAPVGALMRQLLASKPPLLLPEDVTVAHKTGNLSGICIADVGIVELKDRPYLICVICNDPYTDAGATSEIAELSQSVYRAFAG